MSDLLALLRKLLPMCDWENVELQPELTMGKKFYFTDRLSTLLILLSLPFCLFHLQTSIAFWVEDRCSPLKLTHHTLRYPSPDLSTWWLWYSADNKLLCYIFPFVNTPLRIFPLICLMLFICKKILILLTVALIYMSTTLRLPQRMLLWALHWRQIFSHVTTCSPKDRWFISEVSTVGNNHHSIHPALPQVLEWTLLKVLLSWNPVVKGLVWVVQKDVIRIKLPLWGGPAEGQLVSGILCDLQICDSCWNWKEG